MQVSVEVTGGLERRLTVELPWTAFEERETKELKNLQKRAKIPGFRPGKAPLDVVRRNSQDLRHSVVFELMRENMWPAIEKINNDTNQSKLNLASAPRYEMPMIESGQPIKLIYVFEVFPTIEVKDLNGMEVTQLTATLNDADIDQTIEKLRQQLREWQDVTRAAQNDDRVIIDFEGFIDDQPFNGNAAKHFSLELGSKRMIPGFEDALIGVKPGDERTIDVTFPADYHATDLAGKAAKFKIHVHNVQEAKLPEIDAKFASNFGITDGTVEGLRKELHEGMARELDIALRNKLKQATFDKLLELNQFDVPNALLAQEIEQMRQQMESNFRTKIDKSKAPALFAANAKRRVMLGLLLNEIVKQHDIKANADRVKTLIEQRASAFEKPEEMVKMYFSNKHLMEEMESLSIEEQVVEKLLANAKVVEKASTFSEVMQGQ
jgi:trigger factor